MLRRARPERVVTAALALIALLAFTPPVDACPSCATGRQARSEVWRDDFATNLLVTLLPFLLIGAVCVYAERGRRR